MRIFTGGERNRVLGRVFRVSLLCILLPWHLQASHFPMRIISTDEGLPQSNVTQILKDNRGIIWLSTDRGLVKFDGNNLKEYSLSTGYPFSLIRAVIEKEKDELWVLDFTSGLWSLKGNKASRVSLAQHDNQFRLTSMAKLRGGRILVGLEGEGGIYLIQPDGSNEHWTSSESGIPRQIISLSEDRDGNLLLGSFGKGVAIFNEGKILGFIDEEQGLPSNEVRVIQTGEDGNLWIGTRKGLMIEGREELSKEFNEKYCHPQIQSIFIENEQSIWVSLISPLVGLAHIDSKGIHDVLKTTKNFNYSRSNDVIVDEEGILFAGTPYGLFMITNRDMSCYDYTDGLSDPYIKGIAVDDKGVMWIGTKHSGVFYLENGKFISFAGNSQLTYRQKQVISLKTIGDTLWVATLDGVIRIKENHFLQEDSIHFLDSRRVRSLNALPCGDVLVTCEKNIFKYARDGEISRVTYNLTGKVNSFWGTEIDRNGDLICATNGMGLWRLHGDSWQKIPYRGQRKKGAKTLVGIRRGSNGVLLLPSLEGAFSWDGKRFKQVFDLPIAVWDMIQDDDVLWLGTSKGLYRHRNGQKVLYNKMTGLVLSEINMMSMYKAPDGDLWFGGIGGVVRHHKGQIHPLLGELHTMITSLEIDDQRRCNHGHPLHLDAPPTNVTFNFVAPSYRFPQKVEYRYRLVGFDDKFHYSRQAPFGHYTNLPPGHFQFKVQARLDFNSWGENFAILGIDIPTPWWRTIPAYIVYLLLFSGLVWCLLKWRTRKLTWQNKKLEEQIEARLVDLRTANQQLKTEVKDRITVEKMLEREKEQLDVTLSSITEGVVKTDSEFVIEFINHSIEVLFQCSKKEIVGRPLSHLLKIGSPAARDFDADAIVDILKKLAQEPHKTEKYTFFMEHRETVQIELSGVPIESDQLENRGFVFVIRDISLQQKMEREVFNSKKLESLGILAGGIAHGYNNIFTGILNHTELLRMGESGSGNKEKYLQGIEAATQSAKSLTAQLLTFSEGGAPVKEFIDVQTLIVSSVEFALKGSLIKPAFNLSSDLHSVQGDERQLAQVFHNLTMNARRALEDNGNFHVTARNKKETDGSSTLILTFTDSGSGIPEEIFDKIFDPFFTTGNTGTGLGLTMARSIVEQHGGSISVSSSENEGTQFTIVLPAAQDQSDQSPADRAKKHSSQSKILIMEDEDVILETLSEMLSMMNYSVVATRDGREAVEAYRLALDEEKPFNLVILDWIVPGGMGGEEALREILKLDASARIVVSSGYSTESVLAKYEDYGLLGSLPKPYGINELKSILSKYA